MLFSIIIPTYNPRKTLERALQSICLNDCLNEIEVIIADDCSTEDFSDILNKFNQLNIVRYDNDVNRGDPYWGREYGRQMAKGDWLTFMDQDDEWYEHAFDEVKKLLESGQEIHNLIITDMGLVYEQNGLDLLHPDAGIYVHNGQERMLLTHSKFIERAFIEKYNLFYDDLRHCHDINFMSKVYFTTLAYELPVVYHAVPTYAWHIYVGSVSREDPIGYLYDAFFDACNCTFPIIIELYEHLIRTNFTKPINPTFIGQACEEVYTKYFEIQMFFYFKSQLRGKKPTRKMYRQFNKMLKQLKKTFGISTKDMFHTLLTGTVLLGPNGINSSYPFLEKETYKQFLRKLPFRCIFG